MKESDNNNINSVFYKANGVSGSFIELNRRIQVIRALPQFIQEMEVQR